MSIQRPSETSVIERRLGEPPTLSFPDGWTTSQSWKRAQAAPAECGPATEATFHVLMGYVDREELGDDHRVLFALQDDEG